MKAEIGYDGFPKSRQWRGKWIWPQETGPEQNVFALFRRDFELAELPTGAMLHIAADTRYQLYVNGTFIARGAPQSQSYFQYYDSHDLAARLRTGVNCLAVMVNYLGTMPSTRGGLLVELTDAEEHPLVVSDALWLGIVSDAWFSKMNHYPTNKAVPFQEQFDARRLPMNWTTVELTSKKWPRVQVLCSRDNDAPPAVTPWTRLLPRDIPPMTDNPMNAGSIAYLEECLDLESRNRPHDLTVALSRCGRPIQHSRLDHADDLCSDLGATILCCSTGHLDESLDGIYDPCIVLDFGQIITAYTEIDVEGASGAMLDMGYAERLIDGHFVNTIEGLFADRYILKEGRQRYRTNTWKSFRYLKLRAHKCQSPLILHRLQAIVTTYPYEERGNFQSSDQRLNDVFKICRRSLRLCSHEFLMDTPWREQAQWLGDVAAVTLGGIYACFGDTNLPGKFLRQSGANQYPSGMLSNISNSISANWEGAIPDYSLWWVIGVWQHYLYTGEERWLHCLYPVATRIIQDHLHRVNEFGLIENMAYWVFIDWAAVDKRGVCSAYNAIFFGALTAFRNMAAFKEDTFMLNTAEQHLARIKEHFELQLFDRKQACFPDARVNGEFSTQVSEHGNLAPILWGLCRADTAQRIVDQFYIKQTIAYTEAQPFFCTVVLQALDRIGRFDLALDLIRERWGKRMVDRGADATHEEWGINGSWRSGEFVGFMRTMSHAWSAHPAEFLIRNLMGLTIVEPGLKRIRLKPRKTDFDYHVRFPAPAGGVIDVKWHNGDFAIHIPPGIEWSENDGLGEPADDPPQAGC